MNLINTNSIIIVLCGKKSNMLYQESRYRHYFNWKNNKIFSVSSNVCKVLNSFLSFLITLWSLVSQFNFQICVFKCIRPNNQIADCQHWCLYEWEELLKHIKRNWKMKKLANIFVYNTSLIKMNISPVSTNSKNL